jgi:hypothetical protein
MDYGIDQRAAEKRVAVVQGSDDLRIPIGKDPDQFRDRLVS